MGIGCFNVKRDKDERNYKTKIGKYRRILDKDAFIYHKCVEFSCIGKLLIEMKRYNLDVIVGGEKGIINYYIDADGYDCSKERYVFQQDNGTYLPTIVASFPINRTIIKRIDDL